MKKTLTITFITLLIFILSIGSVLANDEITRGGMVKMVGQWGSLTNNFNPFLASGQNAPGTRSALYETIFFVSILDGEVTPVLGTSYEWTDNNKKLVIKTREGVNWSDGTPFTAKDVAFTFNYMKEYPALDLNGVWANNLEKVEAVDNNTVELSFSKQNIPVFRYVAHTLIVPEHIWSEIDNPSTYTNTNPVVTGPFVKGIFNSQAVIYPRNKDYWMEDKPYVDKIAYQAVKSNDTTILMLLKKKVDYSNLFVPDVNKAWAEKDTAHNKYWWPVTNANILYLNNTKAPFDNVAFRQALANVIDKDILSEKALYGVVAGAHSTGIIPGQQSKWLDKSLSDEVYNFNPEKSKEILKDAGYTWDASGALVSPEGNKVPSLNILVGAGWTDFISMAQLISENAKEIGVQMDIQQEPWNSYINSLMGGTYDTAISWGTGGGSTPYDLYYRTLESSFSGLDDGSAESNYSRYSNPDVDEVLATFRSSSDPEVQFEAISYLQNVVLTEVPYIPLTYRANTNIYQDSVLAGWPTEENPISGGDPGDELGARIMLLNLHLKN